jgi:hypothetical protein
MRKALLVCLAVLVFSLVYPSDLSGQQRARRFAPTRPVARTGMSAKTGASGPGPWVQMAKLTSSDTFATLFGLSVAMSGNTLVVGASEEDISASGQAAYVFVEPSGGWNNMKQVARLTPSDQAGYFANSVSIIGDTIVVGSSGGYHGIGAVYVYVKPAGGWKDMTETAKLTTSDTQLSWLGKSVSFNGDTIVAGAPGDFADGQGKVCVFVKPAGGWKNMTQTAELVSSDIASGDNFGWSVGISGDTVVAGAPQIVTGNGKGYVFVKPANGWQNMTETAELTPSTGGFELDFGYAAAIDGNTAVFSQSGGNTPSPLYVFVKPQSGWRDMTQTAELAAPGISSSYGNSVDIKGNAIVTGDYLFTGPHSFFAGAAFLFVKPASGWKDSSNPDATFTGSDAHLGSCFGQGAAISGKTIVATAPFNGNGNKFYAGAGYVFIHP